jgi:DNA-binding IclR family transcriptional regulator
MIAILDCFSVAQPELGVREVARQSGLSTSTAGRLMADLKEAGLLKQNLASRVYSPGSKVLAWSSVYMATLNIRSAALPYMEELRRTSGETVTLYILEGNDRLCVERMESQHNIRMVTRVGQKLPLYAGSAGKAILAFMPMAWIDDYLGSVALKPLTARTVDDASRLRGELDQIRQDGYAASFGEWILEASGVAAPIFGLMGAVLGAVSISGPGSRFTPERVVEFAAEAKRMTQAISLIM